MGARLPLRLPQIGWQPYSHAARLRAEAIREGVVFAWCPQLGPRALDRTNAGICGSDASVSGHSFISARGRSVYSRRWTDASEAGLDFGLRQPITSSTGFTVGAIAAPTASATQVESLYSQRHGSSPFTQIGLLANANATTGAPESGRITLFSVNTGGSVSSATKPSVIDGGVHTWLLGNSPDGGFAWRDGIDLSAAGVAASGTFNSTSQRTRVGNLADSASTLYTAISPLGLVVVWNRLLSLAERVRWSDDPGWVFFEDTVVINTAATPAGPSYWSHTTGMRW